jgi:hypothetical protein
MKSARKSRTQIASLPGSRWVAYSTAALASGFVAGTSEGENPYSVLLDQRVVHSDQFGVSLGAPGVGILFKHFEHFYGSSSSHDGGSAQVSMYGASGKIAGMTGHGALISVSNLPRGVALSGLNFLGNRGFLAERSAGGGFPDGQFLDRGVGVFGFRFNLGAGDQYGWARVKMRGYPENNYKVIDYAYGDPGESVFVGQKTSEADVSQSLGDLAAGGAALRAGRVVGSR